MAVAITRPVPNSIAHCELTHLERQPIDVALAREQHLKYEETLEKLGCELLRLPAAEAFPDSVFVEDTAVVLDEVAIITRPGAESRRGETRSVATALARYRPTVELTSPATLDGGDVLLLGRRIFVGLSTRSGSEAVAQLRAVVERYGYSVTAVEVTGCLHLKSAATALPGNAVLVNPRWVDPALFGASDVIEAHPAEAYAANVLTIGDDVMCAGAFPRTRERLAAAGYPTHAVEASELAKAEGALTCCSIIVG